MIPIEPSTEKFSGSIFNNTVNAARFVIEVDGYCGFDYARKRLHYQSVECPKWDSQFGQIIKAEFPLLDYLFDLYQIDAALDSAAYCSLYHQQRAQTRRAETDKWEVTPDRRRRDVREYADKSLKEIS